MTCFFNPSLMGLVSLTLKTALLSTASLMLAGLPSLVLAQDSDELETVPVAVDEPTEAAAIQQDFEPAFFEQYGVQSALDMISQIPGFQLRGADFQRGLGQSTANVIVNGARLTGKTDVGSQLNRIPADTVVRIEIRDGATLDIPGLSGQVANIVTKRTGLSGRWSWEPEFRERMPVNLNHIHFVLSGESGDLSWTAELRSESQRNGHWGPETLTAADGTLFEVRDEVARYNFDGPGAAVDLVWKPREDYIGNLNLEYNKQNFAETEYSIRRSVTDRGDDLVTVFTFGEDEWNASIGADYEFPFLDGRLKTIGYYRFERSPTRSVFNVFDPSNSRIDGSIFTRVADEAEAIGRMEYSWKENDSSAFKGDWQFAVEGAFNVLDIGSGLEVLDSSKDRFEPVPISDASSRVEEIRTEASVTFSRPLSAKWDFQTSVGAEFSELSQAGGLTAGLTRSFFRPKGFALATYKPDEDTAIRFRVEREVGQLDFFDFISSVDVRDDFDTRGNINLVPSQSWLGSVEYDRDFGDGITLKITPYIALISDLVDRIPIGEDGDAIGNIDNAVRYGVDFDSTIKGDRFGLKGMQLNLELELRDSSVDDPLTGESRRLSFDKTSFWFAEFRHDIANTDYAYGIGGREFVNAPGFRLDTIINNNQINRPIVFAFAEHKDVLGMRASVRVTNLLDTSEQFERSVFTARRDQGMLDFTEFQSRKFGPILTIGFNGTF